MYHVIVKRNGLEVHSNCENNFQIVKTVMNFLGVFGLGKIQIIKKTI